MKLDVEVLASTSIKRKKPWPQIVWGGQEKESLFLLDAGRISVLYVPSGKTKRKVPKLSPLVDDIVHLTPTKNGLFLTGLLKSGDVFLWHKDRDLLKTVTGLTNFLSPINAITAKSRLCSSDDCSRLLVVVNLSAIFVWQQDPSDSFSNPQSALTGKWTRVVIPENIPVPSPECLETTVSTIFYSSQVLGECCQCTVTFNNGDKLCMSTLLLRFSDFHNIYKDSPPNIHYEWSCLQYSLQDINRNCEPVHANGAFVACYSHDGQVIAVSANQMCPSDTSLLFVSPLTETVLVSEMRGCGVQNADKKSGRCYWISSMSWTYDNLFLACILGNGSVSVLSRLGEPLVITTTGCSIDLGPSRFIPIHPVIRVQHEGQTEPVLDEHGDDPLQQVFSVSTHPSLPIILFSDGYMVTVVQLPCDTTTMTFMRDLILESSKHLQFIQEQEGVNLTLASPYNLPSDRGERDKIADRKRERIAAEMKSKSKNSKNLRYSFESLEGSLNETQDSEVSVVLDEHPGLINAMQNLSSGKIIFGEPEMMMATVDSSYLSMAEQEAVAKRMQAAKVALFMSWKLAASHSEAWSADLETVCKNIVENTIRMFTLILDCPAVSDMINPSNRPPSVQNTGLFQVITMYRQMVDLLQFDIFQQHLIPVSLRLLHRTASLILDSKGLDGTDHRLKTLNGCYTLIRFSEKTLNKIYVWQPRSVTSKAYTPRRGFGVEDQFEQGRIDGQGPASQLLSKKVSATLTLLYRKLVQYQTEVEGETEARQTQSLLCQVQENLQRLETPIPQHVSPRVSQGDKHSLDGQHTQAIDAWSRQLQAIGANEDSKMAARILHSELYTFLLRGELMTAIDFVDSHILRANIPAGMDTDHLSKTTSSDTRLPLMTVVMDTMKTLAFDSPDMVPCIRDRSIRQMVQTMARFMAAYFTNQTVYIYPPANPQPLPAVHFATPVINNRIIPKYQEDITRVIRQQKLSSVWTTERTLEYLLLSGLVCEATWFADKMGDWKAAFMMGVGCMQHHFTAPQVYAKKRKPLTLPEGLSPSDILKRKLQVLLGDTSGQAMSRSQQLRQDYIVIDEQTNTAQLSHTLGDILTAGLVGRVETVPWLLTELVEKLKMEASHFLPLVPDDFYLPAPPLYCPQPSSKSSSMRSAVGQEMVQRKKCASVIQLLLCVLKSTHLSLPCVAWYITQLARIQDRARQFKANMEGPCLDFPDLLTEHLNYDISLTRHEDTETVQLVLSAFRDFCSVLWMLHARDNLSLCLRKRQKYLDSMNFRNKSQLNSSEVERWEQECFTNLRWAVHLLSFSRFLPNEGCVYKVILSLLLELPPSEGTADILAEYFYDAENLDPEVQDKLEKILNEWKTVIVKPEDDGRSHRNSEDYEDPGKKVTFFGASPRGKSLSMYFHKQCQGTGKVLKRKRSCFGNYEEFVFSNPSDKHFDLCIGSRPFETKELFIQFMDTFCSVSFTRLLETELEKDIVMRYPVLLPWADVILNRELTAFLERASHGQKKHSLVVMTPRGGSVESLPKGKESASVYRREASLSVESEYQRLMKAKGLFRSKSVVEMGSDKATAPVRRYESQNDIDELGDTPGRSKQGSQQNLSELASKFYKSEEVLHRHEEPDHFWTLNVNFGRRYMPLRNILEWLENWSKKPHSLGLGKQQQQFNLKPTMKIAVPSQLVLLSLWLLENKYLGKPQPVHPTEADPSRGHRSRSRSRRKLIDSGPQEANLNLSGQQGHMTRASASPQGHSPSRDSLGVRTLSPHSPEKDLKSSALLEEENVRSYYEQLLNGPDDSSSLGVSSLASDELDGEQRQTLSIIRGTGSPKRQSVSLLNRTIQLPTDGITARSTTSPLNTRGSGQGSHRGQGRGSNRSPSSTLRSSQRRSAQSPSPRARAQSPQAPVESSVSNGSGLGGDIASQLQNIVRSEMRRIMEVQHKSLMAMMGAIDGPDAESHPVVPQQQTPSFTSQNRLQELHQRPSPPQHGVLRELHNLQINTDHSLRHQHISPGKENTQPLFISDLQHPGDKSFPKFLRIPPERDNSQTSFKLPHIPVKAWDDQKSSDESHQIPHMPLLRIAPPSGGFLGIQKGQFPIHPPPYESPNFFSMPQKQDGQAGMPLLHLPNQNESMFGRMVPPELVVGHQRELEKQRHLQEVYRHQTEEQEEMDKKRFGENLLRLDFKEKVKKSPRKVRKVISPPEKSSSQVSSQSEVRDVRSPERDGVRSSKEEEKEEETPDQEDTEEEEESGEEELHDGYAIQPGAFEAYLHLGKALGVADGDTNARFQYQLAMKMREQQARRKKKVDFATMTRELVDGEMATDPAMEVVRTAEAATSITKDTGVDPIQEAVIEYNQARQGTVVPPDVFMGLRFSDGVAQPDSEGAAKGAGHSYLNVVDIRASTVLRDLAERPEEVRGQSDVSLKPSSISASVARRMGQDMDEEEERLRQGLEPRRRYNNDAVTVRMFETRQAGEDRISVALMPKQGIRESKMAMIRRLKEMNEQIHAIDEMSNNMESDFLNTHMLINTLEAMADAAHPSSVSPTRSASSPGHISEEERLSGRMTPKASERSPQPSARSVKSKKSSRTSADASHMSGLSGISDIIGEVIAEGGVDLAEAGISTTDAEKYMRKHDGRTDEERLRMSVEKLQQIVSQAKSNADAGQRDPEQRRQLQEWMAQKFSERQRDFRRQREELREREISPYKPAPFAAETTMKNKELQDADMERFATRKYLGKENMDKRFEDAELLLGDILVDKPHLPKEKPISKPKRKVSPNRTTSLSPKRTTKGSPMLPRKTTSRKTSPESKIPRPRYAQESPKLSLKSKNWGRTKVIETNLRRSPSPESPTRKGILKTSDNFEERIRYQDNALGFSDDVELGPDSYDMTGGSTADLLSYARHVEEMDTDPVPFQQYKEDRKPATRETPALVKPYKQKAFHELVRLQRPDKLRKGPTKRSGPSYVERLSSISRQNTARESSREEKEKLYGTKHIPGSTKKVDTGPRRVKTYAERLQEMKPKKHYSTPIVPRQHVPESVRSRSTAWQSTYRKATPKGPPHKPQTYVEQLKKINAGATKTLKGGRTVTVQPRTFMKARKPAHPPQNYVDQLQTINAQAPETLRRAAQRGRYPSQRGTSRPRPYGTPYRSMEEDLAEGWEAKSEVSDWVVEDDVRQLIYGDDDTSVVYTVGGTASAVNYPMSDGRSDYYDYVMGEEGDLLYTNSVDVDEIRNIADAVSVDSGSVLSVIDWDAVDRLIEDEV